MPSHPCRNKTLAISLKRYPAGNYIFKVNYSRFSYAGTWELVNLFVGTKKFSYHIFHENIGRKHSQLTARLHETRSELKPVWNLKPLWNVPFTWQFTWRFHCGNFPNNSKTLLHMCKWYFLINVNLINAKKCYQWKLLIDAGLINAKQMLRYWFFFKQ